jgi:hypothetical protein
MRVVIGLVLALVTLAGGIFLLLGSGSFVGRGPVEPVGVSREAALRAEQKLDLLEGSGQEVRLTGGELSSLFLYRPDLWSFGIVTTPQVRIRGDTIYLTGRVDPADLPSRPEIDAIRVILPDTTRLDVAGRISSLVPGSASVEITSLEIAGMPFPPRYFPFIVDRLGLPSHEDLPAGAFSMPLPTGVAAARVSDGLLILSPERRG